MRNAYLKDLSQGGVFIRTGKVLPLDARLEIDLLPPGWSTPIQVTGKVVRVQNDEASIAAKTAGMGLQFIDVSQDAEQKIEALVAEYSKVDVEIDEGPPIPPPPAPPPPPDDALDPSGEIDTLRGQLADKENELIAERARRLEAIEALAALTAEHESLKDRAASAPKPSGNFEATKKELDDTVAELASLKARLASVEGQAAAYREELEVLEQDDSTTRQLAEALARDKAKLLAELEKARTFLASADKELEIEKTSSGERITSLEGAVSSLEERAHEAETALSREKARASDLSDELASTKKDLDDLTAKSKQDAAEKAARISELEARWDESTARVEELETELRASQKEATEAKARAAQLEKDVAAEQERANKAKAKERDLRRLLAAVSKDNKDAVPDEDLIPPRKSAAEEKKQPPAEAAKPDADVEVEIEAKPAAPPDESLEVMIDETPAAAASDDDEVDIEDEAPLPKEVVVLERGEFDKRCIANAKVVRSAKFGGHTPLGGLESRVFGNLERAKDVNEFIKMSKGDGPERDLLDLLFKLHQHGLIELS